MNWSALPNAYWNALASFYMNQPLKWDYLWAALCMMGAVYFVFK